MMMKKPTLLALLTVLAAASAAHAQAPAPSAAPSPEPSPGAAFPAQIELVTVDVVVTDKKGNAITGLTQADFQITEDDRPQSIASFESVQVPTTASAVAPQRPRVSTNQAPESRTGRSFVVLFDDVHLTAQQAQRAKLAVSEFLRTGVREGDRVTLVATGGGAWWSTRMEAGRDELIALLKRLDGRFIPDSSPERMSDHEAMRIHVYRDAQYEARVSRRFDTYGVSARAQQQQGQEMYQDGDPFVRARAADVYFQALSRNRITMQVLERVMLSLAPVRGRKSVILVSQGFIYDPNMDEFKTALQASRRSNAALYFLDTRGLSGMPAYFTAEFGPAIDNQDVGSAFVETLEEAAGAESLASDSGGFSVKNTNDLAKGIVRIAEDSRSYYLLGYNPADPKRDGKFRKIQVKVPGRKGLQIRARKGYYAPLEGKVAQAPKGTDPDIQAALDSPYDERQVPIRMTSYVFDETLLGKANVIVAADVDVNAFAFKEENGRFADTLEFLMVVAHRETGEFFRYDQKIEMNLLPATRERVGKAWMPVVRDFELSAGGYQAKLVVRDKNSGAIGTLVHEFEVPDLASLRVSTPVISDTLLPQADKTAPPRAAVVVRRTFAPSVLYAQFEVYGAAREKGSAMPRVSAGYEVRRKGDGTVAVKVEPSRITPTSLGKLARFVGASLEQVPDGDYEFVLTVTDQVANKTVEVREPFTLSASAPKPPPPPATP
jgi:VWFA-related protein